VFNADTIVNYQGVCIHVWAQFRRTITCKLDQHYCKRGANLFNAAPVRDTRKLQDLIKTVLPRGRLPARSWATNAQ
jgi:hypothetical protein